MSAQDLDRPWARWTDDARGRCPRASERRGRTLRAPVGLAVVIVEVVVTGVADRRRRVSLAGLTLASDMRAEGRRPLTSEGADADADEGGARPLPFSSAVHALAGWTSAAAGASIGRTAMAAGWAARGEDDGPALVKGTPAERAGEERAGDGRVWGGSDGGGGRGGGVSVGSGGTKARAGDRGGEAAEGAGRGAGEVWRVS